MNGGGTGDIVLLQRVARTNDAQAFSELVGRYENFVFSVCMRVLGNQADAEDACHECFIALARDAAKIKTSLAGWLHHSAVGRSIDMMRRDSARRHREEVYIADVDIENRAARWQEMSPHVDQAMDALSEEQRYVLIEHFLRRRTETEIAAELGVSAMTVSRRVQQGVEQIREKLRTAGITVNAVMFAGLMLENSVVTAPAALTASLGKMAIAGLGGSGAAGTGGGVGSASVLGSLIKGGLVMKAAIGVVAATVIVGTVAVVSQGAKKPEPARVAAPAPVVAKTEVKTPASDQKTALEKDFWKSFWGITFPPGAMVLDKEENFLRAQVRTLVTEVNFIRSLRELNLSKNQMEEFLGYAQKAREACEARIEELHGAWTDQIGEIENYKMRLVGADRKMKGTYSEVYPMGAGPAFRDKIRALEKDALEKVLTEDQRKKLPEMTWLASPGYVQALWWCRDAGPVGPIGNMLMAPNACSHIERQIGKDPAESLKREGKQLETNAELFRQYRDIVNLHRRKVPGANFMGGLNLTLKQIQELIDADKAMGKVHAEHAAANRENLKPLVKMMIEFRDLIAQDKDIPDEKLQSAVELQKGICRGGFIVGGWGGGKGGGVDCGSGAAPAGGGYPLLCMIHKKYTDDMEKFVGKIKKDILTDGQTILIYTASSCYFPPAYVNSPIRVGEVAKTKVYPEHAEMLKLRSLKGEEYTKKRDTFLEGIVATLKREHRVAKGKEEDEMKRLTALMDKIHDMADADYELERYDLLGELLKINCREGTDRGYPVATVKDDYPPYYEKPLQVGFHGWNITLQEMPLLLVGDPEHIQVLEQLAHNIRNFKPTVPNLEGIKVSAEAEALVEDH